MMLLNTAHPQATDFGKEIIPDSIAHYKVVGFQYDGYWTDIGNIYSFYEANLALTQEIPPFNLFDNNKTVYSRPRMLPPAKISGTTLRKNDHCRRLYHSCQPDRTKCGRYPCEDRPWYYYSEYLYYG